MVGHYIIKLQSSLTVQSKTVGLGVDLVSPCHNKNSKNPPPKSTRGCTTDLKFGTET